jgi:hypothetical protein
MPTYNVPFLRLPSMYTKKLIRSPWVPAFAGTSGWDLPRSRFSRAALIGNGKTLEGQR